MQIDPQKTHRIAIETSRGSIELDLYPQCAPKTVNNFVFLSRKGFYDGVSFHGVVNDFIIQGGDPTGTGRGGPGYRFEDEVAKYCDHGMPGSAEAFFVETKNLTSESEDSKFGS
jgi:peptidyl-prolyl cis-trans isomerase B (cyclophilin B)